MSGLPEHGADLSLVSKSEVWHIRRTLEQVEEFLEDRGFSSDRIDDINLVLAEAMTNIVRHSNLDTTGEIRLSLSLEDGYMNCELVDTGVAFDPASLGHTLPDPGKLKEGGYGWFIIRHLSQGVQYSHENGRNSLSFTLPLAGAQ